MPTATADATPGGSSSAPVVRPGSPGGAAATVPAPPRGAVRETSAAKDGRLPAPIELDSGAVVELLSSVAAHADHSAAGAQATGGEIGLFTLRLSNSTGSVVDLTSATVSVAYGRPAREAEPVADLQLGYGSGPLNLTLSPGVPAQLDRAFAIPASAGRGLTLTFRPATGRERVTFTNLALTH
jgi:hypothetical protein